MLGKKEQKSTSHSSAHWEVHCGGLPREEDLLAAEPLSPNHFLKVPPDLVALGFKFPAQELWGHIQKYSALLLNSSKQ